MQNLNHEQFLKTNHKAMSMTHTSGPVSIAWGHMLSASWPHDSVLSFCTFACNFCSGWIDYKGTSLFEFLYFIVQGKKLN